MINRVLKFTVPQSYNNAIANDFLRQNCRISARTVKKIKKEKNGILRNNILLKTIDTVKTGDIIQLTMPKDQNEIKPTKGSLNILYEDNYILIVNKPYNMPVHPTKIYQSGTLANLVVNYAKINEEYYQIRIVNRLDKDTSGIVVIAKNRHLAGLLPEKVKKIYSGICEGKIVGAGTINKPIKVKDGHTIQRCTNDDGQRAITHYEAIKHNNKHTLLKLNLETGRTHQIRCHFSSIGNPLAGDDMYGGSLKHINRQALHCSEVEFVHPINKEKINIKSEIPEDMLNIIK